MNAPNNGVLEYKYMKQKLIKLKRVKFIIIVDNYDKAFSAVDVTVGQKKSENM